VDVSEGDEKDVDKAVEAAKEAFKPWKNTTAALRAGLLRKLGELIFNYTDEIAYVEAVTMGGPASKTGMMLNWVAGTLFHRTLPFCKRIADFV
jgi:acyl-CoA reductase-like NAD-dependent aldehyde dehydrogenase